MHRLISLVLGALALLALVVVALLALTGSSRAQATIAAPELLEPADGAQLQEFGVSLRWLNPPGATQYYLEVIPAPSTEGGPPDGPAITLVRDIDTSFTIEPPVLGQGNYLLLPDMTYTWRVQLSDSSSFAPPGDGSYGPAAQRTFRTPAASSGSIRLLQPASGSMVNSATPLLRWEDGNANVFYYEVQLSKDVVFNTGGVPSNVPVYWELVHGGATDPLNSYQVRKEYPLDGDSHYFWRVRPRVQGDGSPLLWSRIYSFRTPAGQLGVERVFPEVTFQRLTNMVQPDDGSGRFFATEQQGIVYVFREGRQAEVFLDIRSKVLTRGNEEGLLGLALDPNFRENRYFYLYYSASNPRRAVVSRFAARADDPDRADAATEVVIMEVPQPYSNHNGGQLAFGPDGYLYLGPGDGGSGGDPSGNGQNLGTLLGKILRIDVRGVRDGYSIPPDNPFVGVPGARPEVWAYGMRNPWRFSFDSATGRLWAADVGQNAWEEVNRVERGGNYGWNVMEGRHCFKPSSGCDRSGLILPLAEYSHSDGCSVTGGFVYRGQRVASLQGAYLYADYCSGKVWALWQQADGSVSNQEILDTNLQIASFAQDLAGEVYILSHNQGIYRFVRQ